MSESMIPHPDLAAGCSGTLHQTVQKYPTGSVVNVDGHEWTVIDMSRDNERLLPSQTDRGEDYNLYRLSRHNSKTILRWQYEIDKQMQVSRNE